LLTSLREAKAMSDDTKAAAQEITLACPNCGGTEFSEDSTYIGSSRVQSFEREPITGEITPEFADDTEIHWDCGELCAAPYCCLSCFESFRLDQLKEVTEANAAPEAE